MCECCGEWVAQSAVTSPLKGTWLVESGSSSRPSSTMPLTSSQQLRAVWNPGAPVSKPSTKPTKKKCFDPSKTNAAF